MTDTNIPIIVLVGPSGSGKTSAIEMLENENAVIRVTTLTTRHKRESDTPFAYNYCKSREDFFNHTVIEYDEYDGELYGTSEESINDALAFNVGLPILAMTYDGAIALSKKYGERVITIFLYAPPIEIKTRLKERGENDKYIKNRLIWSKRELKKCMDNKMNYIDYFINTLYHDKESIKNILIYTILSITNDTRFIRGNHELFGSASNELPDDWRLVND